MNQFMTRGDLEEVLSCCPVLVCVADATHGVGDRNLVSLERRDED